MVDSAASSQGSLLVRDPHFSIGEVQGKLVNGQFGDAACYCFFVQSAESILFDCGDLSHLSVKELLRVSHLFVSHTHIDHFIGFDILLRVHIAHGCHLKLFGPSGFIQQVYGKLCGYTWNLLEPQQLIFDVVEISNEGGLTKARLSNDDGFIPHALEFSGVSGGLEYPELPARRIAQLKNGTFIDAVVLDHRTPVVAYRAIGPRVFQVNKNELDRMQLQPGAWIKDLQGAAERGKWKQIVDVFGKSFTVDELARSVLREKRGSQITYVTDIAFSKENLSHLIPFSKNSDLLVCESCFSSDQRERAAKKMHLTTRQAAMIARSAYVAHFLPFHFSNLYVQKSDFLFEEFETFFAEFSQISDAAFQETVSEEHIACSQVKNR